MKIINYFLSFLIILKETFRSRRQRWMDERREADYNDLDTFDVRWVEGLPSQSHRHQYDDRLPGLAGRIRRRLAP